MKKKAIIQIFITIIILVLLCVTSFYFGEKYAYSKVPEISLKGSMKFNEEEQKEIIKKANKHINENSADGIQYFLTVSREQGDWIVFEVRPIKSDFDTAFLYTHMVNGEPVFFGPGTAFPGLSETYPEIFK